jgi:hypothetical protein
MDWSNEDYVRVYTRETPDDIDLSWEALALWRALLTKFDRSGLLPVRNGWASVAKLVRWPVDVVERAGPELVRDGRVRSVDAGLFAPNFMAAQTASKSDRARQKELRDRRREEAAAMQDVDITTSGHAASRGVTHESRGVTQSHSLLCSADPLLRSAEAMLIPPIQSADEKPAPAEKRGKNKTRLPADWSPTRSSANLKAEGIAQARGVDLSVELEKLRDWASGGAHKRDDWDSVWRNWTRNARAATGGRVQPNHSPTQVAFDELARLKREAELAEEVS